MRRIVLAALTALMVFGMSGIGPVATPVAAQSASVVPTQWIAKLHSEALGRAPTPAEWSAWQSYYETNGCTRDALRLKARELYLSPQFNASYPESTDKAARVIALVRGVGSHDLNANEWTSYYTAYADGSKTWPQTVDTAFSWGFGTLMQPSICDAAKPGYGFATNVALDVRQLLSGQASRTQTQLQSDLDAAGAGAPATGACSPVAVSLHPYETVRVGSGGSVSTLKIPRCVSRGSPTRSAQR